MGCQVSRIVKTALLSRVCGKTEPVVLITGLLLCNGLQYRMVARLVGVPGLLLNIMGYRYFVQKHTHHVKLMSMTADRHLQTNTIALHDVSRIISRG